MPRLRRVRRPALRQVRHVSQLWVERVQPLKELGVDRPLRLEEGCSLLLHAHLRRGLLQHHRGYRLFRNLWLDSTLPGRRKKIYLFLLWFRACVFSFRRQWQPFHFVEYACFWRLGWWRRRRRRWWLHPVRHERPGGRADESSRGECQSGFYHFISRVPRVFLRAGA